MSAPRTIVVCEAQVPFVHGGAEVHVRELVRELTARGYEAELVSVPFKWYPKDEILPHAAAWRLLDLSESNGRPIDLVIVHSLAAYRRMLNVFEPMRDALVGDDLDATKIIAILKAKARLRCLLLDQHQAGRVSIGQRPQQHGVEHREGGGRGADTERQGDQGERGESGLLSEGAERPAEVVHRSSESGRTALLSRRLHHVGGIPEPLQGPRARGGPVVTVPHLPSGLRLDMEADLFGELFVALAREGKSVRNRSRRPWIQDTQRSWLAARSTRPTPRVARSHHAVSASSRRRPVAVSR